MKNYGIPYMGSKQAIVASIAMVLPKAENFYDLFGGGFSITHYMLENKSHKYKNFYFNEIKTDVVELIKKAISGAYNYDIFKPKWISREEFFAKKDIDAHIRLFWSFGNDQKTYLFSKEIEPYKKSMHQAIVFDNFDELAKSVLKFEKWPGKLSGIKHRRVYLRNLIEHYRKTKIPKILYQFLNDQQLEQLQQLRQLQQLEQLERLQKLQQLEQLERLQQLEQLERLERLHFYSKSYDQIEIKKNSVVYCDIPYQDTKSYMFEFDHKVFFEWAATRDFPVYISEYRIDDKRFKMIYEIKKTAIFNNSTGEKRYKNEKIYWNGK